MIKPTPNYILVSPIHESQSSAIVVPEEFTKENNERRALSWGHVVAIGSAVKESLAVGDKVLFRDGTYWKNKERRNNDEIKEGLIALLEHEIVMVDG